VRVLTGEDQGAQVRVLTGEDQGAQALAIQASRWMLLQCRLFGVRGPQPSPRLPWPRGMDNEISLESELRRLSGWPAPAVRHPVPHGLNGWANCGGGLAAVRKPTGASAKD
jgi:hypothetical protein